MSEPAGLTPNEVALCRQLGACYLDYRAVVYASSPDSASGQDLTQAQQQDLREFAAHIHDLQHAVMARAAIRAHPDVFRP
jgi:hypothetical protein